MCHWQIHLPLSKHGLCSAHTTERKAEMHLLKLHVSVGLSKSIYLLYNVLNFM